MKTNFSWANYWAPTPKKIRQWADAILITTASIASNIQDPIQAKIIFGVGILLKLLSNLFKENGDEVIAELTKEK